MKEKIEDRDALFEEYRAITDLHKHFDTMNLSMMSTITAGIFILWGIMLRGEPERLPPVVLVVIAMVVFFVLSSWIRYMSVHRSIVARKLARACEIERCFGMRQNSIFQYDDPVRRTRRRPGAHAAEITVYILLTFLGATAMTYGCVGGTLAEAEFQPNLIAILQSNWYLIPILLFQGGFVVYWAVLCRTLVVEVLPHYQLPENGMMRYLFVKMGSYRDCVEEIATIEKLSGNG